MSTPPIAVDPYAAYGGHVISAQPTDDPYRAYGGKIIGSPAGPQNLDANPSGQGTYNMWDTAGRMHAIPYSLVPVAHGQGYQFDTNPVQDPSNPSRHGLTPLQAFQKDEAADPNRIGGTSMPMAAAGTQWSAQPEPTSRQESLQRLADAEKNASLPQRVLTGAMKGAATVERPVIDLMNLGSNGNTPAEQSYMMEGRTPEESAAKASTIGATMLPAVVAAPVPTALGLAGGSAAGYVGGKAADAMGASPKVSAVVGDAAGMAGGIAAGTALPKFMPEAVRNGSIRSGWDWVNNRAHDLLAGDVNKPIPGTDISPAQRYDSMVAMGLRPNAAEATNSKLLQGVEKLNQNSLTSAPLYDRARAENLAALNRYTDHVLDNLSPFSPEEGGATTKQGLLAAHQALKTAATEGYQSLDAQVGNEPLAGAQALRQQAQAILDANAPYYKLHPELEPVKAMSIVRDLANGGKQPRPGSAVIPGFGPAPQPVEVAPRGMSYSELHRLRSDLLDFNNTNPDLVKNQANGWISQLAGAADHAITSSEGGLSPQQVDTFRNANDAWKFMKDTFDNPSHPFYSAVRTPSPSTLVSGLSSIARTPEMANTLVQVLGKDGVGPVQRGVMEGLLGTTKEGGYNFKNFQGKWNKLNPGVRDALFTPEQQEQLEDIGNAGTVLNTDLNPSGSAKLGQAVLEGKGILNPLKLPDNLLYHPAQRFVGKKMNNPAFVDWLMRDRGIEPVADTPPVNPVAPSAVGAAAGVAVDPHTGPLGQPNFYPDAILKARAAFDAARAQQK